MTAEDKLEQIKDIIQEGLELGDDCERIIQRLIEALE